MGVTNEQLFTILQNNDYLEKKKLDEVFQIAQSENQSLYELLLEKDLLTDEQLGQLIADFFKVHYVHLSKEIIQKDILFTLPEEFAKKNNIIAFKQTENAIFLATSNPSDTETIDLAAKKAGYSPTVFYATQGDIEDTLGLYKKQIQTRFNELITSQMDKAGKIINEDIPVEQIVEAIIEYAYNAKASDIHIEPKKENSIVRLRIDGILHDVLHLPHALHDQIVTKIKVESRLRTDEHQAAQDGKMQHKTENETVDIRVSIVPIINGEACVLRLLTSRHRQFGLQDLGMNKADLTAVEEAFNKPFGMILSTGPTGSGKTTTIYSVLKILNTKERNIATIEDPVEYDIDGVNQIQVNPLTNLTFADGLRSILRQDPDIIYVGEIRDNETASIAINAATTGHLVLSTLHTNNAATSIPRFIDMKIEPFLISSTVHVIIGQRLIRKICDKCKVSYTMHKSELHTFFSQEIIKKVFDTKKDVRLYKGKGCQICHHTGYMGRIGIFEVLRITPTIQTLINTKSDSDIIMKQAIKEGMTPMTFDGLQKVEQGITTIEEILRVTKN